MKLASFLLDGRDSYGIVAEDKLYPVDPALEADLPDLITVIAAGRIADLNRHCMETAVPLSQIALLPPITNPGKIICAGMNYRKPYPVEGMAPPDPDNVVTFARHTETLVGHGTALELPPGKAAESFDFEGEIVAVIGKRGRFIAQDDALDHVMGYSIMNEGSVRGWMKHSVHAGKNFHASGSWGPWITTADEFGDPTSLKLETRLNGDLMQSATVGEMIFSLSELIAYISNLLPLNPGDIIATGSPDGTGGSRKPPVFLKAGDYVSVTVSGIGTLKNSVGAE
jgi:2-keto-4-pentenoate hydratase/2-oxohepta-3-ene-1,7-dioic acid hydratase in catechol pathway